MGTEGHNDRVVLAIGAFKLVKAALLIGLAIVSFRFAGLVSTPRDPLRGAAHAVAWLGAFPGRHAVVGALRRAWAIEPGKAETFGFVCIGYSAVFLVEGMGLLFRKRWAEWLTIAVTTSFVPFEIYELVEHFGIGKIIALVLNVAVVVYLVWHRLRARGGAARRR